RERTPNPVKQRREINRFRKDVTAAGGQRVLTDSARGVSADGENRRARKGAALPNLPGGLDTVQTGHGQIHQDQVWAHSIRLQYSFVPILGLDDLVALGPQPSGEEPPV